MAQVFSVPDVWGNCIVYGLCCQLNEDNEKWSQRVVAYAEPAIISWVPLLHPLYYTPPPRFSLN